MNELQLIRSELAVQRLHARCTSHLERLPARPDLTDADRQLIERCAREFQRLAIDPAPAAATNETHVALSTKAELVTRLTALVDELEALAESRYALDDWRRAAHIDADSVLEERRLRKKLVEQGYGRTFG